MKVVKITIQNGVVNADYSGFEGDECVQLDERVRPENMDVDEVNLKSEYHLEPSCQVYHDETVKA